MADNDACLQARRQGRVDLPGIKPVAFLHIDCDLFAGAHDAFTLLSHKIVPGTIILFDELVNYKLYREHEIKAFFEWLQVSGAKVAPIGMQGPIQGRLEAMDLDMAVNSHWSQAAAFVVVSKPSCSAECPCDTFVGGV